ncbi:hypothetical protein F5878DRAFT_532801 [Lentinula raphanica]|uniref:Uncharacterized protein n=1 Tax=Lentinula raphanica TaxID=153919 RepID=A0AA38PE35_9AGAR|nr:hypothetical protein F5878DRAFT_532801 [Lentinula raphanica]
MDYRLNCKTTLSQVYQYPAGAVAEYPETSDDGIGHLFEMDVNSWPSGQSPGRDFAYSRGEPRGNGRDCVTIPLLVDSVTGEMVPCMTRHSTCQGVKVCPYFETDREEEHHYAATREQLQVCLQQSREQQASLSTPARAVFERTSAYLTALKRIGCESHADAPVSVDRNNPREEDRLVWRRGYPEKVDRCTGKLLYQLTFQGIPCINNGRFDLEYLRAILSDDEEEIDRIEARARTDGFGPRTNCQTVLNNIAQRNTCPWSHRDKADGVLEQPQLISLKCCCVFREYEPLEPYRASCPFVLITSKGAHTHPIPLPEKTPSAVIIELESLFKKLEVDLADMSPRKFARHPIVQSYLNSRYPMLQNPMLSDLHISLSNRSHLKAYIDRAKSIYFPEGTGWKGLLHFKAQQDAILRPADRYLRVMIEIADTDLGDNEAHDDFPDESSPSSTSQPLRIAICMTSAASKQFVASQYLQSDIAFKRIVGFYEFEIATVDEELNTSFTLCRVYLTRQTATAHKIVLAEIDKILISDTGRGLRWRHIHGSSTNDYAGNILNWVVDQHRGQAKGIGLYLQDLANGLPLKYDLHEPLRTIQSLSPYDHLRRFLTLCTTHLYRNIRKCSVSDQVRNIMRNLICIEHDDWDGALEDIRTLGGKAGQSWLSDKETSKFAFPAMCWEKSLIPLDIWQARRRESNVVEITHANVNLEGTQCTLLGGVYRGRHFDLLKQCSLAVGFLFLSFLVRNIISADFSFQNNKNFGIRESYSSKHLYENASKNMKRKCKQMFLSLKTLAAS